MLPIYHSVPNFMIYVTAMYIWSLFLLSPSLYLFIASNLSSGLLHQWGSSWWWLSILECSTITTVFNYSLFLWLLLLIWLIAILLLLLWWLWLPFIAISLLLIEILFTILSAYFNSDILWVLSQIIYLLFSRGVILESLSICLFLFELK